MVMDQTRSLQNGFFKKYITTSNSVVYVQACDLDIIGHLLSLEVSISLGIILEISY